MRAKKLWVYALLVLASIQTIGISFAVGTPAISSTTDTSGQWSNSDTATLTWQADANTSYECSWSNSTARSYAPCTGGSFTRTGLQDGNYLFYLEACDPITTQCSEPGFFNVLVDKTAPAPPQSLTAVVLQDGSVKLSWNPVDDNSGIQQYVLYRSIARQVGGHDFTPQDTGVKRIPGITTTTYVDTEDIASKTRFYRVQAVDNAGNSGAVSRILAVGTSPGQCTLTFTPSLPGIASAGMNELEVSSSTAFNSGEMKVRLPDGTIRTAATSVIGKGFDVNFQVPSGLQGNGSVMVSARDGNNNLCQQEFTLGVDSEAPAIEVTEPQPDSNQYTTLRVEAEASDTGSGMAAVRAEVDDGTETTMEGQGGAYSASLDITGYAQGIHVLKVVAIDNAGNQAYKETVFNVVAGNLGNGGNASQQTTNNESSGQPFDNTIIKQGAETKVSNRGWSPATTILLVMAAAAAMIYLARKAEGLGKTRQGPRWKEPEQGQKPAQKHEKGTARKNRGHTAK